MADGHVLSSKAEIRAAAEAACAPHAAALRVTWSETLGADDWSMDIRLKGGEGGVLGHQIVAMMTRSAVGGLILDAPRLDPDDVAEVCVVPLVPYPNYAIRVPHFTAETLRGLVGLVARLQEEPPARCATCGAPRAEAE